MANTKITTAVIKDDAITTAKIADDAVTSALIADDVALGGNPTTTTQSAGNNTTRIATTAFVTTAVSNLVDSAPSALDTLNELAAALGDDASFSTTVTNSIATKLPLAGGTMTGDLTISSAGPSILLTDTDNNPDYQIKNGNGSFRIIDTTNSVDRININTSGVVGLGTDSPDANASVLSLKGNDPSHNYDGQLIIHGSATSGAADTGAGIGFKGHHGTGNRNLGAIQNLKENGTSGNIDTFMRFVTRSNSGGLTEAARLTSGGSLLVGKTEDGTSNAGHVLFGNGAAYHIRDGGFTNFFNRLSSDGEILRFAKGGTTVGNIGTINDLLTIGTGDAGLIFNSTSDAIYPWNISTNAGNDNAIDLGIASRRIRNIYVSSGIYLGGTGAVNHLDEYEEGNWTPAIGSGTATYGTAWFVRIGRLVTVHANVYSPSDAASGNNVYLSGLPFASGASSKGSSAGGMIGRNISNGPFFPYVGVSSSQVYFYDQNSGTYNTFKHSDMSSTTDFHFTLSYFTDL